VRGQEPVPFHRRGGPGRSKAAAASYTAGPARWTSASAAASCLDRDGAVGELQELDMADTGVLRYRQGFGTFQGLRPTASTPPPQQDGGAAASLQAWSP
jgi:hypothetical protein